MITHHARLRTAHSSPPLNVSPNESTFVHLPPAWVAELLDPSDVFLKTLLDRHSGVPSNLNLVRDPELHADFVVLALARLFVRFGAQKSMRYEILRFQLRQQEVCEIDEIDGDVQSAGHHAFRPLSYFFLGHNDHCAGIAMTAPALQVPATKGNGVRRS